MGTTQHPDKGTAKKVYAFLTKHPGKTFDAETIAVELGIPRTAVGQALAGIVKSKLRDVRYPGVVRTGPGNYMLHRDPVTLPQALGMVPKTATPPPPDWTPVKAMPCPDAMIVCRIGTATDGSTLVRDDDTGTVYKLTVV